jgi:hypothetical protein
MLDEEGHMNIDQSRRRLGADLSKSWLVSGFALLGLMSCGGETQTVLDVGTLELPLRATANGHTYQLTGYVRVEQDPWAPPYYSNYIYLDGDVVSFDLPAARYTSELQSWQLAREVDGGLYRVEADLLSPSRQSLTVFAGSKSTLTYRFSTDGFVVATGTGGVDVTVAVNETVPDCTPFGNGCGEGTWCAPTELTGRAVACIEHGSVPLGEPCTSPTSCVAEATCRSASPTGVGQAVCTALCPTSELGEECANGRTCRLSESGYGICTSVSCGDAGSCFPPPPPADAG